MLKNPILGKPLFKEPSGHFKGVNYLDISLL